jgi:organic hydroperoxide reductase OsmC/OhrA
MFTLVGSHLYSARCHWQGDTGLGWDHYERAHTATAPPATQQLTVTTGESKGDPTQLNPEQLLVMAASSCQLLWFLHLAAKARVGVIEYDDEAEGEMPEDELPVRVTRIVLRPRILVREGPTRERIEKLVELAHHECYIANSLKTDVLIEPRVEFATAS